MVTIVAILLLTVTVCYPNLIYNFKPYCWLNSTTQHCIILHPNCNGIVRSSSVDWSSKVPRGHWGVVSFMIV